MKIILVEQTTGKAPKFLSKLHNNICLIDYPANASCMYIMKKHTSVQWHSCSPDTLQGTVSHLYHYSLMFPISTKQFVVLLRLLCGYISFPVLCIVFNLGMCVWVCPLL